MNETTADPRELANVALEQLKAEGVDDLPSALRRLAMFADGYELRRALLTKARHLEGGAQ